MLESCNNLKQQKYACLLKIEIFFCSKKFCTTRRNHVRVYVSAQQEEMTEEFTQQEGIVMGECVVMVCHVYVSYDMILDYKYKTKKEW